MHYRARIVAGTALALVMTAAHAGASSQAGAPPAVTPHPVLAQPAETATPVLLAQAENGEAESDEQRRRREEEGASEEDTGAEDERAAEPAPEQPAPPPADAAPVPEPAPEQETPAPAQEAPPPPADAPTPPAQEAPPPADGGGEPPPDAPTPPPADAAPTPPEQAAPPAADEAPVPPEQDATPPAGEDGAEPIPGTPPPADEAPTPPAQDAQPPAGGGGAEPVPDTPTPPAQDAQPPASGGAEPIPGAPTPPPADGSQTPPPGDGGAVEPVREAPVLDSDKEAGAPAPDASQEQPAEAAPPPASDQEAQQFEEPVEVESLRTEEGRRVERREERRERPEGANVLREIGDRIVIQLDNQVVVQSDDRGRIGRDASETYYEELPRGRVRETVVRPSGVQVVTVYDRYGDVIRRSRIMPDGREHVLVYAGGGREREERRQWRDPGLDLPPLRLGIPADEYILDAGSVRDEDVYYDFLDQPPVDRVRRLYSVDEVRYSARVRDSVRRIDLDTITFEFGSASISEEAIPRLSGVAEAMARLLEQNPGETFLIEGHTDAVGSDEANLALSDRRAEGVAMALTSVFDIPPENLVTQGYGERYLKIATQEPERENRRVAIRRITPLVAPVASR